MIEQLLAEHEYQEWDINDGLLYPGPAPTICRCGATPGTQPEGGDWSWWVGHVAPLIRNL